MCADQSVSAKSASSARPTAEMAAAACATVATASGSAGVAKPSMSLPSAGPWSTAASTHIATA